MQDRIRGLEQELSPKVRLEDADLVRPIPLIEGDSLLGFSTADETKLFEKKVVELPTIDLSAFPGKTTCENQALKQYQADVDKFKQSEKNRLLYRLKGNNKDLKRFLENNLNPQRKVQEEKLAQQQRKIEVLLRKATSAKEQLAIYAGRKQVATIDELRQALAQNNLEKLQREDRLPSSLDLTKLREELISYFDTLSRKNAADAAIRLIEDVLARGRIENKEEWQSMSTALHRLLTIKRRYDIKQEPRLLVFEAQQFINLKPLDGGLDQLDLLNALVSNPYAVIQAPTGSGKTSVLSVMRSLLKATGKNLVIQQVLPSLYNQTYDQLKDVLGELFGTSIYALRFHLKMRMVKTEIVKTQNLQGVWVETQEEHSIFKSMYCDMLDTIKNKGCVLTDYKSLPLIEGMFLKVNENLLQNRLQGVQPTPLLIEHHHYLKKILILLANKSDADMDEFDQPNRPIQKIQIDLGIGSQPLPPFLIDTSMEIYEHLEKDPELGFLKNIQGDLSEEMRQKSIHATARKMAKQYAQQAGNEGLEQPLFDYMIGKSEDVLNQIRTQSAEYRDKVNLCKDQFSIYLALILRGKEGSRYARSEDGLKTLPCYNGEKHDAKFGTILEQVGYIIADYCQTGITAYDLNPWLKDLKQKWDDAATAEEKDRFLARLHRMLPELSMVDAIEMMKKPEESHKLVAMINKDLSKVKEFLRIRLSQVRTSGVLISMNPQNMVDIHRAVSGVSATMGAPESLHRQFQVNANLNGQIQAGMLYRLKRRVEKEEVIQYDPEHPETLLNGKNSLHTLIDGSGAFKEARKGAELLKNANPNLEKVSYHTEEKTINFVGRPSGDLKKTGFFFSQPYTRGTDIPLVDDAKAILTLNAKDGIREYFQKEGRLRLERQRYQLAMPKYQGIRTISQELSHAIAQDALVDAQDIFRKSRQELPGIIRFKMKEQLLAAENLQDSITVYQRYRSYFISEPEAHYAEPGSYFNARHAIQQENQKPEAVLHRLKEEQIGKARELGLDSAIEKLNKVSYSPELLSKMPDVVAPIGAAQGELETEVHVESEEEGEAEAELEASMQTEQQRSDLRMVSSYPTRENQNLIHSVQDRIHRSYHHLIHVTDSFLPFSRLGIPAMPQRRPFDSTMYRIGEIYIDVSWDRLINKIVIEDPLKDFHNRGFCYDIRTNRLVTKEIYGAPGAEDIISSPEFVSLIAQIKFLDGRVSGYSDEEFNALRLWLATNNPQKMKEHLLNDILRYRYQDKLEFPGSQLHRCFESLGR